MINLSKLSIILIFTSTLFGMAASANNNNAIGLNKLAHSLCESTKNNQVAKLRASLMHAKTHIRTIYPKVKCNNQSLLTVAINNQSDSVVTYLKLKAKPELEVDQKNIAFTH